MMTDLFSQPNLTHHARQRCQQRGIRARLLRTVLENADVEYPSYGGSVLVSVSRARAEELNIDDLLCRLGVVLANDGAVITVAHILGSRRGKAWRLGRRFVTPNARHVGHDRATLANRAILYANARAQNPERWSGKTRNWQPTGPVWLNPENEISASEIRDAA